MTTPKNKKTVVILQSNYIPWKGYFDLIRCADVFVLYDDMQFTRRDWRNRNQIKTPHGLLWLTIPVEVKGKFDQRIRDTRVAERSWANTHWKSITANYVRAPFFSEYKAHLEELYRTADFDFLSDINHHFLTGLCKLLKIEPNFRWSSEFTLAEERTERLAGICQQLDATTYISGPAAKDYMDVSVFDRLKIEVQYFNYSGYPTYPQLYGDFTHAVSVIDLLFNAGPEAMRYLNKASQIVTSY